MPTDVPTWEETTDVPAWDETKAVAAPPATPRFDTSKVKLTPYQEIYLRTGMTDPSRDTAMTMADIVGGHGGSAQSAANVLRMAGAAPGAVMSGAGSVARGFGADFVSAMFNDPEYGGNLRTLISDDKMPVDKFLSEVSKTNPKLATLGKIGQGIAGTAPMLAIADLPAATQKVALLGFTGKMMADVPDKATQLGSELGKPKDQQDSDKITSLVSDIAQDIGFSAVGGVGLKRGFTKPQPSPLQGPPATGAVLQRPPGAVPPPTTGATEFGQIPGVPTRGIPAPPMPDPRLVRARPVVPGTPAEPRETSIQTIQRTQAKTVSQIQQLFPKAGLSREQARVLRNVAWGIPEPTTPTTYAETIRGNQGQLRTPGQVAEGGEAPGRHDLEQAAPGQPEPVDTREETEGKIPLTPEPGTVRLYRGQPGAGGSGSFWSTDPNYARSFGENVQFVDVPKDVADSARAAFQKTGSGTPGAHILPDEWQKKAQPMERPPEQKAQEVPDEPETVISPAVEVKGQRFIGADHGEAIINAAKAGVDATKAEHVFLTSQNRLVNRMQGKELFEKQTGRKVSKPEQGLHSEDMKAAGVAKRAAEPEKPTVPAPQDNWQVVVQTFRAKFPVSSRLLIPHKRNGPNPRPSNPYGPPATKSRIFPNSRPGVTHLPKQKNCWLHSPYPHRQKPQQMRLPRSNRS